MKIKIKISKWFSPFLAILCINFMLAPTNSYAGYLVPVQAGCSSCQPACDCYPVCTQHFKSKHKISHHKHHIKKHFYPKHHLCSRDGVVIRTACAYPIHEYVEFRRGPYASCGGYWADLDQDYYYYPPDMATGDDNAMIYPDMNIDN